MPLELIAYSWVDEWIFGMPVYLCECGHRWTADDSLNAEDLNNYPAIVECPQCHRKWTFKMKVEWHFEEMK